MSFFPGKDPQPATPPATAIEQVIVPRSVDLGDGFTVHRALPSAQSRMVGPFIFFDHFGPAVFRSGNGLDVRPHPHIGLATVTYLFDGEIMHRDSLGTAVPIRPGEVNWMTAGRGIVHSERTGAGERAPAARCTACKCGSRCRAAKEEMAPAFAHHAADEFPMVTRQRQDRARRRRLALRRALAGPDRADTMFADVALQAGATLPLDAEHEERAHLRRRRRDRDRRRQLRAGAAAGVPAGRPRRRRGRDRRAFRDRRRRAMDGPRHIWWNFVSSRKERIEQAKADWEAGHFDKVPGDEIEFIPLPEK